MFWTSHILMLWAPVSWDRGPQGSEPGQEAAAGGQAARRRRAWGFEAAGETVVVEVQVAAAEA